MNARAAQWRCRCGKCPAGKCCQRGLCTDCARAAAKVAGVGVPRGPWNNPRWHPRRWLP
jgi:hypothetical protein